MTSSSNIWATRTRRNRRGGPGESEMVSRSPTRRTASARGWLHARSCVQGHAYAVARRPDHASRRSRIRLSDAGHGGPSGHADGGHGIGYRSAHIWIVVQRRFVG
ncbi:hypothetical protein FAIPA1_40281 [Frankia sp. AiPs1]